jgi:hypothetical protein
MKIQYLLVVALISILSNGSALSRDGVTSRLAQIRMADACIQIVSCGTKNGQRKEYPDPCTAEKDGATDITPKIGSRCEVVK